MKHSLTGNNGARDLTTAEHPKRPRYRGPVRKRPHALADLLRQMFGISASNPYRLSMPNGIHPAASPTNTNERKETT